MRLAHPEKIIIIIGTNRSGALSRLIGDFYVSFLSEWGLPFDVVDLQKLPDKMIKEALYAQKHKSKETNVLIKKMEEGQKYIWVVPQYNGSIPGVLKTFIDAYAAPKIFTGKKSALVGVSKGAQGNLIGLGHLSDILTYLGMTMFPHQVHLSEIKAPSLEAIQAHEGYIDKMRVQAEAFVSW